MRVLRGRAGDPAADDTITGRMIERSTADGEPLLRVWRPDPHCSFGRRDARADGYRGARELALERGFPPFERRTGGSAVAYTGTTVAFGLVEPIDDIRNGLDERYDAAATAVQRALWRLGVPGQRGEPEHSFCPGSQSLQWQGKLAGFAQRVQRDVALVGGIVIVDGHDSIGGVLDRVYEALGHSFDPGTVGSIERAGGRADSRAAVRAIEAALTGGQDVSVERVDQEG